MTPIFYSSFNSGSPAHATAGWALGRRAPRRPRSRRVGGAGPGGVGVGKGVELLTCFCSSLSPLIASSTGNRDWARWETRPASGDSDARSLQLATRRPSNQAVVAISALQPSGSRSCSLGSTNPWLRCPQPSARGWVSSSLSPLISPRKAALPLAKTRANQR